MPADAVDRSAGGATPRTVIGAPLYNNDAFLETAISSILSQSRRDFRLILVDDASTDRTPEIAQAIAGSDARASYVRNETRLGLAGTWRRCVELARQEAPAAEYFAWGSDHDLWDAEWLAELTAALDADTGAVLACPRYVPIDEEGEPIGDVGRDFSTPDLADPMPRALATQRGMAAGSMVYGLFRLDALESAGALRPVLFPDRLLLLELSFRGRFLQVPRVLWYRRFRKLHSVRRQRRSIFPNRTPAHAYLPGELSHLAVVLWLYGVRGIGRPLVGRPAALGLCVRLVPSAFEAIGRRRRYATRRLYKQRLRGPVRRVARRAKRYGHAVLARVVAAGR